MTQTQSLAASETRYETYASLLKRWDRVGRKFAYKAKTKAEHARWRRDLLKALKDVTGFSTFQSCPLKPKVTETIRLDGYTRQRVEIQTEPGIIMPFYALVPDGDGPFPAVLCPHGHASGGKYSPAGRRDIPEIARQIQEYNYDYGVQFVREGFIALCPDARGFGERQEPHTKWEQAGKPDGILIQSCQYLNQMGYPLGQTVTGMWAWDLHRLIDYVETRKDCVPGRLACAGLSGGGLQTLWASGFDERIKCAVVSGYFYGYKESLLEMHWNCSCNFVPHLYELADIGDVAGLIAPRPLLIETGDQDPLNGASGMKNVTTQLKMTRKAYRTLGVDASLRHHVFPGGHKWSGVEAIPWVKQWVSGQ